MVLQAKKIATNPNTQSTLSNFARQRKHIEQPNMPDDNSDDSGTSPLDEYLNAPDELPDRWAGSDGDGDDDSPDGGKSN